MRAIIVGLAILVALFTPMAPANATDTAASTRIVQVGDSVQVSLAHLDDADHRRTVEWTQGFGQSRFADFVVTVGAASTEAGSIIVPMFIEVARLDEFRQICVQSADGRCAVPVTNAFRYGQDESQTLRFLVFLNPSHAPFQHRFLMTDSLALAAESALEMAETAGAYGVTDLVPYGGLMNAGAAEAADLARSVVGDPLREF